MWVPQRAELCNSVATGEENLSWESHTAVLGIGLTASTTEDREALLYMVHQYLKECDGYRKDQAFQFYQGSAKHQVESLLPSISYDFKILLGQIMPHTYKK